MSKTARFMIRGPEGDEPQPQIPTPNAALSKALNLATRSETPGAWDVVEYEDVLWRVRRMEGDKLDVRVEVVR